MMCLSSTACEYLSGMMSNRKTAILGYSGPCERIAFTVSLPSYGYSEESYESSSPSAHQVAKRTVDGDLGSIEGPKGRKIWQRCGRRRFHPASIDKATEMELPLIVIFFELPGPKYPHCTSPNPPGQSGRGRLSRRQEGSARDGHRPPLRSQQDSLIPFTRGGLCWRRMQIGHAAMPPADTTLWR